MLVTAPLTLAHDAPRDVAWEAETSAAIVDLVVRLSEARDLNAASQILADELQRYFGCRQVAVGVGAGGACQLRSVSGLDQLDRHTTSAVAIEAALHESLLRREPTLWTAAQNHAPATQAHAHLAGMYAAAAIVSVPLAADSGPQVGALLLVGGERELLDDRSVRLLAALAEPLAACLGLFVRAQPLARWQSLGQAWRAGLGKRRRLVTGLLAVGLAALCLPWPYRPNCDCELQPVVRRHVVAPFAGVFEKSLVEPGDTVTRDQVLGRMDGREIRWELAGLEADQSRAGKSRDVNMAGNKVAAAQIDRLEMERLEQRRRLLAHRADHLEIKSPVAGVVIAGDLKRSEGVTLTVGQPLFEIAPLDRMVVELAIADDDVRHVAAGQPVSVALDAFPGQSFAGTLRAVCPRSETRDGCNVFIGEVEIDNSDGRLRPGMKGTARVTTARQPLAWILFHEPWYWLTDWVW